MQEKLYNRLLSFIMAHFLRWMPHQAKTGVFPVGNPDKLSPVFCTCNYSLTIKRVLKAIKGLDAWLLIVPTKGINVWCSASGGELTHHQIITTIKVHELNKYVDHRNILLPQLCAPGVNPHSIKKQTGFIAHFGPVLAEDIKDYLKKGSKKTPGMKKARSDYYHRLDMVFSMNFINYLLIFIPCVIFFINDLLMVTLLFWGMAFIIYLFYPYIPGKRGITKAFSIIGITIGLFFIIDYLIFQSSFIHWPYLLAIPVLGLLSSFDVAGTVGPNESEAIIIMQKLGMKSMGSIFKEMEYGAVILKQEQCTLILNCLEVCPVDVFHYKDGVDFILMPGKDQCIKCRACIKQCPTGALSFKKT